MKLLLSDGRTIDLPGGSIDIAYSYQVIEHIHPDDAMAQLQEIHRVLSPGGAYLCVTPNRLNGPHDVSQFFDDEATGFHLREYTWTGLAALFQSVGFRSVSCWVGFRGRYFRVPLSLLTLMESMVGVLPGKVRRLLGRYPGLQNLLFISLCARK